MDKKVFAEKFAKLGLDAKSFEVQRQKCLCNDKFEPHIKRALLAEIDLFVQAANVINDILENDELFSYLGGIATNFLEENDRVNGLKSRNGFDKFTLLVADESNISRTFFPAFFWEYRQECDYIDKRIYSPQLDVVIPLLAEVVPVGRQVLWLIFYDFVLICLIDCLSLRWTNAHPLFQGIVSKEQALNMYVQRDTPNVSDEFPFVCWLFYRNIDSRSLQDINDHIEEEAEQVKKGLTAARIKEKLLQSRQAVIAQRPTIDNAKESVTIKKIDKYSGAEFEAFVGSLFEADGYQVEFTQASNDKGINVIAKRNGISIGIQCKRYSNAVGISSVQEAFSGKNFYSLDKALVVTNNTFTKAAKDLADSTDVVLWDRDILNAKIRLLY